MGTGRAGGPDGSDAGGGGAWVPRVVLDACAAPGNKATHLCALLARRRGEAGADGAGTVVAVERDAERARVLRRTAQRMGASGVRVMERDFLDLQPDEEPQAQEGGGGGVKGAVWVAAALAAIEAPCRGTRGRRAQWGVEAYAGDAVCPDAPLRRLVCPDACAATPHLNHKS
jgi:hypothetical protein